MCGIESWIFGTGEYLLTVVEWVVCRGRRVILNLAVGDDCQVFTSLLIV